MRAETPAGVPNLNRRIKIVSLIDGKVTTAKLYTRANADITAKIMNQNLKMKA